MPDWMKRDVQVSGARTFKIEVLAHSKDNMFEDSKTWVVSKQDPKRRVLLPVPPASADVPFYFDQFYVSPDESTIVTDRKIAHGSNEMRVLHRIGELRYELAEKQPLNDRIGQSFGLPPEWKDRSASTQSVDIVRFQQWLSDGRHAVLACVYIGKDWKDTDYLVTLDARTGKLSDFHRVKPSLVK